MVKIHVLPGDIAKFTTFTREYVLNKHIHLPFIEQHVVGYGKHLYHIYLPLLGGPEIKGEVLYLPPSFFFAWGEVEYFCVKHHF